MRRIALVVALSAGLVRALPAPPASEEFVIGLYHRPSVDAERREALWAHCGEAGVTDLFVHTFYHGFTIYPSNAERTFEQRPDLAGRDLLGEYIAEGHAHGIRVHAWLDLLLWGPDPSEQPDTPRNQYAETRPAWRVADRLGRTTGPFFVTPAHSEVSNLVTLMCLEIGHQHPEIDGINLDQVRYPGGGDFTYDSAALHQFVDVDGNPDPREDDSAQTQELWRAFAESRLRELVRQIGIVIHGIHGDRVSLSASVTPFDPARRDADLKRQAWPDWLREGSLDAVVVQCFAADTEVIRRQAEQAARIAASARVPCWIGLAHRAGGNYPPVEAQLEAIGDLPTQGVVWFSENWLAEEPDLFAQIGVWARGRAASPEAGATDSRN